MTSTGAQDLLARIGALADIELARFLAIFASELTVRERSYFADAEYESARQCNELIHRLAGHIGAVLTRSDRARDASFAEMILRASEQQGYADILARALDMCA